MALALLLFSSVAVANVSVGQKVPNALGKTSGGDIITAEAFKGKVLVVSFWASWCGPCRRELPALNALQNAVGTEFIQVVAVNSKEDPKTVLEIMRQLKDRKIISTLDRKGEIGDSFGVNAFPNLWIIDPAGQVVVHKVGYGEDSIKDIAQEIITILRKHNPEALNKVVSKS
jgi:thiol-disulfide isomerase/thioredoxin